MLIERGAPRGGSPSRTGEPVKVEICVDRVDSALVAEAAGADRVELCADLSVGGITPSIGMVATVLRAVRRVGVHVLIRPRGGDFRYSALERDVMAADIDAVCALAEKAAVPVGFVLGALTDADEIDVAVTRDLVRRCAGRPVTFHKAFDRIGDLERGLDALLDLGVDRVLTSGGRPSAVEGTPALASLVARAGRRIVVLAGGGVRPGNARTVVARTGVPEVHLRAHEAAVVAAVRAEVDGTVFPSDRVGVERSGGEDPSYRT
ncbi:copper homeostasis protein CutC [Virgisporangium aliadipatigenens]|uniref:PF03932 family protein CutC n=1 Tax=Virgisporangium aliadipatigenens TaxID=741659 RepID=A0A8J3YK24_9ACTN|nr:copper homeostasis protein CutC [Virgisporangium aliadipatigenens]GIJ45366.1 copper homeostasis protein CutC [Virgisporangium aliadipatigenens]